MNIIIKTPNKGDEAALCESKEILEEMGKLDGESGEIMSEIKKIF